MPHFAKCVILEGPKSTWTFFALLVLDYVHVSLSSLLISNSTRLTSCRFPFSLSLSSITAAGCIFVSSNRFVCNSKKRLSLTTDLSRPECLACLRSHSKSESTYSPGSWSSWRRTCFSYAAFSCTWKYLPILHYPQCLMAGLALAT